MKQAHSRHTAKRVITCVALSCMLFVQGTAANEFNLPTLGDSASSVISLQQEEELGQLWLRTFRSKVPALQDPMVQSYLMTLVNKIAASSDLENRHLEVILVDNKTMNAFAVPGGVMGVHGGIFYYAANEAELSSVIAHEIAHLSQRHFARSVQRAQEQSAPMMAALLASLVLMATTNGQAGLAALTATQAAAMESGLRFSRENEAEADNVGMQTLVKANMNPEAMPNMFENMHRSMRFLGKAPPEFLLSHPVTENRITDSRSRAAKYPQRQYTNNLYYDLMKARIEVYYAENANVAVKHFRGKISGDNKNPAANHYGLAIALLKAGKLGDATKEIDALRVEHPDDSVFLLAKAEIEMMRGHYAPAMALLQQHLEQYPQDFAASMMLAKDYNYLRQHDRAEKTLQGLLGSYGNMPEVWYNLAETRGLANNIGGVHTARAEYYIQNGDYDHAVEHLTYAMNVYRDNYVQKERIQQRLRDIDRMLEIAESF